MNKNRGNRRNRTCDVAKPYRLLPIKATFPVNRQDIRDVELPYIHFVSVEIGVYRNLVAMERAEHADAYHPERLLVHPHLEREDIPKFRIINILFHAFFSLGLVSDWNRLLFPPYQMAESGGVRHSYTTEPKV